ncbi:MAG TPA: hypothetical protein VN700_04245 [Vicinamibacterales bacterium]|nr:hypothetical protein [Vicinamibacterales bacterium]
MKIRLLPLLFISIASIAAAFASPWPDVTAAAASRRIYVVVADATGQPVRGLSTADFFIRLDGKPVELVSAGPATAAASILILTDRLGQTADYRPNDLRKALRTFVESSSDSRVETKYSLTTFDQIVTQIVKFPASPADAGRVIDRLVGSALDAPFVDALTDACVTMADAPTDRRVIFVVYASYRPDRGLARVDATAERCRASNASIWAIESRASDGRNYPNPARERIIDDTSRLSGGMREYVNTAAALDSLSKLMGGLVASQYELNFASGETNSKSQLTVGVKRTGVFVMAPTWRPDALR